MCFKIMLKVTKKQGFILSLENTIFEKPQGGGGGGQFDPSLPTVLELSACISRFVLWQDKTR